MGFLGRGGGLYLEDVDDATQTLADSIAAPTGDRWLFRTAAPALPMSWYGSSDLGYMMDASALECWTFDKDDTSGDIQKATCVIENETGRSLLIFRETIVMESNGSGGCNVTKTSSVLP